MTADLDVPALLRVSQAGALDGASGSYRKRLSDMAGVYRDSAAFATAVAERGADHVVYEVHEQRYDDAPGALTVGTSTVFPGRYGDEFAVTRGHLHAIADRAELYYCLGGRGVMLLETVDGRSRQVELVPGAAVNVPGGWIHRSINVGDEPFVTLFCYASDAGQDYGIISRAGGMATLVVSDGAGGWSPVPNPAHRSYDLVS